MRMLFSMMVAAMLTAVGCNGTGEMRMATDHVVVPAEAVPWRAGPASLPEGAEFAVLEGDPTTAGPFVMRLRLPDGYRIPPHTHPRTERVTVISGTLHLGTGAAFDADATEPLAVGGYFAMQPGMRHYVWADGETEIQLNGIGPWEIDYINPADDPRRSDAR